jgi:hypothetical protein
MRTSGMLFPSNQSCNAFGAHFISRHFRYVALESRPASSNSLVFSIPDVPRVIPGMLELQHHLFFRHYFLQFLFAYKSSPCSVTAFFSSPHPAFRPVLFPFK